MTSRRSLSSFITCDEWDFSRILNSCYWAYTKLYWSYFDWSLNRAWKTTTFFQCSQCNNSTLWNWVLSRSFWWKSDFANRMYQTGSKQRRLTCNYSMLGLASINNQSFWKRRSRNRTSWTYFGLMLHFELASTLFKH